MRPLVIRVHQILPERYLHGLTFGKIDHFIASLGGKMRLSRLESANRITVLTTIWIILAFLCRGELEN